MSGALNVFSPQSQVPVTLGPILFQFFEVPEHIPFGGAQKLTVHKLPGGERIIDAMGRDDAEIAWEGTFSGPYAMDRARQMDALRTAGEPLPLYWGGQYYTVLIATLELDYKYGHWVPYKITCTVLRDEAAAAQQQESQPTPQDDANSAGNVMPSGDGTTTVSQETVGAPGVIKTQTFGKSTPDPWGQGVADTGAPTPVTATELTNAKFAVAQQSAAADSGLQAINDGAPANGLVSGPTALQSATTAAGQSAQASTASGYLNRASNTMEPPAPTSTVIRPNVLDAPDAPRPGTF